MSFSERLALIISANADQAIREITKVGKAAEKDLATAENRIDRFANSSLKIGAGLVAAGGVALPMLARLGQGASDLNEQISGSSVVFRQNAQAVQAWSRNLDSSFGISQRAALTAANNFGAMFTGVGLAGDEATEMSKRLVELSSDLASFKNLAGGSEEALERLRSGLAGEAEPLRRMDIFLNEAAISAKALELGIAGAGAKLTDGQKILARYHLILDQTSLAQGDFARTSDSLANSQRIVAAEAENAKNAFGQGVVGPMTAATQAVSGATRALGDFSPELASTVGTIATLGAATAVGVGGLSLLSGGVLKARDAFRDGENGINNFGRAAKGLGLAAGTVGGLLAVQGVLEEIVGSASDAAAAMAKVSDAKLVETFFDFAPKDNALTKALDAIPLGLRVTDDAFKKVNDRQAQFFDALPLEQAQRLVAALKATGEETGALEVKIRERATAEKEAAASTDAAKGALDELTGSTKDSTAATEDNTRAEQAREKALRDVLSATEDLIGSQLSVAEGTRRLNDASADSAQKERELAEAIREHGRESTEAVSASNDLEAARRDELSAIDSLAKASRDYAVQQAAAAGQTLTDADKYRIYRDELIKLKDQLAPGGPLRTHLEGLINQLPPPAVKFSVIANTEQADAALESLRQKYNEFNKANPGAHGPSLFGPLGQAPSSAPQPSVVINQTINGSGIPPEAALEQANRTLGWTVSRWSRRAG